MTNTETTLEILVEVRKYIIDLENIVKELERNSNFEAIKLLQENYELIQDLNDPYEIKQQMLDFRAKLLRKDF